MNASTGGMYTCVVTNAAGNDSDSTFLFADPYFITEPSDELAANGSTVILQCVAEAFPSPTYQWARADGAPIRDELRTNMSNLIFSPVLFGEEGDYYCNISSLGTVYQSRTATVNGINDFFIK